MRAYLVRVPLGGPVTVEVVAASCTLPLGIDMGTVSVVRIVRRVVDMGIVWVVVGMGTVWVVVGKDTVWVVLESIVVVDMVMGMIEMAQMQGVALAQVLGQTRPSLTAVFGPIFLCPLPLAMEGRAPVKGTHLHRIVAD